MTRKTHRHRLSYDEFLDKTMEKFRHYKNDTQVGILTQLVVDLMALLYEKKVLSEKDVERIAAENFDFKGSVR